MEVLTFEKLPEAVALLLEKVSQIESHLAKDPRSAGDENDLLNITQAAKFLDLAVPTLYSKVSRKEIPVNKQGKRIYFYKSELQAWIQKGRRWTVKEIQERVQSGIGIKKSKP